MVNADLFRTIVGILGNVISFCLFLSPMPTFYSIWKDKSVKGFKPDPYVATVFNCAMWMIYGMPFVHPDSLLVITINGIGLVIETFYITVFVIYSDWHKRRKIFLILAAEAVIYAIVWVIVLLCFHTTTTRSMFIGIFCIILNIAMYASPLTVMKRVIRTKSVKYMPFFLSLANLANGVVWSLYALIKFDPFILIPNGLGTLSGVVQVALYAIYYKSTNWDEDDINTTNNNKGKEVQMQSSSA
ncbi:bidirectional sugar transporter SWEET5-like [Andrographis paniculata]|uniref:bidirectional sugar transporter SWEET5-like n=1 Tax=Andrographis paniculata TaxID=175694 RepID=UPI0021E9508C|nr:bidirectional sugar transporter SWEET5-like [Andrographis paniculata]